MTKVRQIVKGIAVSDGAGVKINRIIGQPGLQRVDPFLMLDEFGSDKPGDYLAGFPQHPHRGFQTVTYMLNGKMGHKDSVGNQGLISDGGLQWMNAGRGIIHEEMPQQSEGLMRGFQLWVNLPAAEKMSAPAYEDIDSTDIPEFALDGKGKVRILSGSFAGIEGPVKTHAVKPQFYDMHLSNEQVLELETNASHQGFVYVYEGNISVAGQNLNKGELAVLSMSDTLHIQSLVEGSKAIFVSGEPIKEPVVQYGPFVMNTENEIHQAINDYNTGKLA